MTLPLQPHVHDAGPTQNDLNIACLRTCVKLLDRLQIRPQDEASTGDDSVHQVSRLFHKYAALLLRGHDECQLDPVVRVSLHFSSYNRHYSLTALGQYFCSLCAQGSRFRIFLRSLLNIVKDPSCAAGSRAPRADNHWPLAPGRLKLRARFQAVSSACLRSGQPEARDIRQRIRSSYWAGHKIRRGGPHGEPWAA